jgi:hypothetical protein
VTEAARGFARWKFRYVAAAGSDPDLSSGDFRLILFVLSCLSDGSRKAAVSDETLRDEVPGFRRDGSLRKARGRVRDLGFWTFEAGSGRRATRYEFLDDRLSVLEMAIKKRAKSRKAQKDERDLAFDALAAVRRGELLPRHEDGCSEVLPSQVAETTQGGERVKIDPPQSQQFGGGKIDPPFNSPLPIDSTDRRGSTRVPARDPTVTDADVARAQVEIDRILQSASQEHGLPVDEVRAILGDELYLMRWSIEEFPGDGIGVERDVRSKVMRVRAERDAAALSA